VHTRVRPPAAAILILIANGCSSKDDAIPDDAGGVDVGSTDEGSEADAASADGASDTAADAGAPGFCTSEKPTVTASGAAFSATTTHYELYAETTEADATELARLLEASSAAFAAWFERPPPAERMKVRYYKDSAAWAAGLTADGIAVPTGSGGYYSPSTKTAYLFAQGNPYYSHVLAVHEATHQFHQLTRATSVTLPVWYAEGHAEYLSRHDWDGQCVRLGVTSLLSWEDLPAKVTTIDVGAIVGGTAVATRPEAWAIFRYLDTGAEKARFKAFRDAFDAGKSPSFADLVAPPASLTAPVLAWLPSAQEPMKPIYTEWIHVGPHAVNVDTPGVFSLAVVKAPTVTHFEGKARVPATGKWSVGVVVSYTDPKNYVGVVHDSDGTVSTFTATGSAVWAKVGTAPKPTGAEVFSVEYAAGRANVTFNGASVSVAAPTPRAGLAANDTAASFHDVSWTP